MAREECKLQKLGKRLSYGQSLTETLVVVVLIITLIALFMPILESSRNAAKHTVCTTNLKQIYNGLVSQSIKNARGVMPPVPKSWEGYAEALVESEVMICPLEGDNQFKGNSSYNFLPEPPPSIDAGTFPSNSQYTVFREQAAWEVPVDVDAITRAGKYGKQAKPNGGVVSFEPNGTITALTKVDSYYFSFEPRLSMQHPPEDELAVGSSKILAFIAEENNILETNPIFVPRDKNDTPITSYPSQLNLDFGLEARNGTFGDGMELPSHRGTINHRGSQTIPGRKDDFRVIASPGSGSSYAMNVEVPNQPANDMQLLLVDAKVPWVEFTDGKDDHSFTYEETLDHRHFGKVNTLTVQGSVELMEPEKLKPDSIYWRR